MIKKIYSQTQFIFSPTNSIINKFETILTVNKLNTNLSCVRQTILKTYFISCIYIKTTDQVLSSQLTNACAVGNVT